MSAKRVLAIGLDPQHREVGAGREVGLAVIDPEELESVLDLEGLALVAGEPLPVKADEVI